VQLCHSGSDILLEGKELGSSTDATPHSPQLDRQHCPTWIIPRMEAAMHCRRCLLLPHFLDWVVPHSIVLSSMAGQAGQPCGVLPRADDTARLVWSLVCLLSHGRERRYLCNPPNA